MRQKITEKAGRRVILRRIEYLISCGQLFNVLYKRYCVVLLFSEIKYYYKRTLISFCSNIIFLEDLLYVILKKKKKKKKKKSRWSFVAIRTRSGFSRLLILPDMPESVLLRRKSSFFFFCFCFFTFYPLNYRALILK